MYNRIILLKEEVKHPFDEDLLLVLNKGHQVIICRTVDKEVEKKHLDKSKLSPKILSEIEHCSPNNIYSNPALIDYLTFECGFTLYHKKIDQRQKEINAPICITDIFIYPGKSKDGTFGEKKVQNKIHTHYPESVRLLDHIDFLAAVANEYHQTQYCQTDNNGNYTIRADCLNKITRLSLNEFSLYTYNPIDQAKFPSFLNSIEFIAKKIQPNVHLLLSSLPLKTKDNDLLNVCLYVQCGNDPIIETFSKAIPYQNDPTYFMATNFSQMTGYDTEWLDQQINPNDIKNNILYIYEMKGVIYYSVITPKGEKIIDFLTPIKILDSLSFDIKKLIEYSAYNMAIINGHLKNSYAFVAKEGHLKTPIEVIDKDSLIISNNSIFIIKTAGGSKYLQIIEICFDHALGLSKKLIQDRFEINILNDNEFMPEQIDELITSNFCESYPKSFVAQNVLNINPSYQYQLGQMQKNTVKPENFTNNAILKLYPKMSLHKSKYGAFIVNNPPFGCSYTVIAAEERPLSGYSKEFKDLINDRNQKLKKSILRSHLKYTPLFFNYVVNKTENRLMKCHKDLLDKCRPNGVEKLLKNESYFFKLKVIDIIDRKFNDIFKLKTEDQASFMHHVNILLLALKMEIKHMENNKETELIKDIVDMLDKTCQKIEPIIKLKVG
jgi:hypothetical protein